MNKRIKELAMQAGIKEGKSFIYSTYSELDGHSFSKESLEKYTELIVKETMQVVANTLPQNTYLDVADAVIKHFGVEE